MTQTTEQKIKQKTVSYKAGNAAGELAKFIVDGGLDNLSRSLQKRIQSATHGWYAQYGSQKDFAERGFIGSLATLGLSAFIGIEAMNKFGFSENTKGSTGAIYGIYCISELFGRMILTISKTQKDGCYCPSLLGKIVSIPLETMLGAYDAIKKIQE